MKSFVNRSSFLKVLLIVFVFSLEGFAPFWAQGATIPTITVPKKTITVFDVAIALPTGDPVTAGSVDNEFTYAAGVALVPVEANITPLKVEGSVKDLIKWTFASIPAGSVLTWGNNTWPGESTAGKGKSAVATLSGYPSTNSEFGPRTIKMEVIRNNKVLLTKTTTIELFFKRDEVASGRTVPNWYFYWLQAIGGRANTAYGGNGADVGKTPGMADWSYGVAQDKTKVTIYNGAQLSFAGHACSPNGPTPLTGIDLFENIVIHENKHTLQISQSDPIVGTAAGTPWRFGWSWNQVGPHNHWGLGADGKLGIAGVDDDSNGSIDDLIVTGPGELGGVLKLAVNGPDVLLSDVNDPTSNWPLAFGVPPTGPTGCNFIEMDAQGAQPDVEGARKDVDWADPGKKHLSAAYND